MGIPEIVKGVVDGALRPFGYRLSRRLAALDWDDSLQRFRGLGFAPRTIIDIGVARGTPALYRNFPDAYYVLVDPLRESVPHMQSLCAGFRGGGEFHNVALGDVESEIRLEVRPDLAGSTVLEEVGQRQVMTSYPVRMTRLDTLLAGRDWGRPCLCKIDVQGAELMVLRGVGERLAEIDMFIVESSFIETLRGAPEVYTVMQHFASNGYALLDILSLSRRPLDRMAGQVDLVFVRNDDRLRSDKRWNA